MTVLLAARIGSSKESNMQVDSMTMEESRLTSFTDLSASYISLLYGRMSFCNEYMVILWHASDTQTYYTMYIHIYIYIYISV